MSLSPSQRTLRARLGAFSQHAQHDPRVTTQRARETFLARFEDQVDPERILPAPERARRALAARRAWFARISLASAVKRGRAVAAAKEVRAESELTEHLQAADASADEAV